MRIFDEDLMKIVDDMRRHGQKADRISEKFQIPKEQVVEMIFELKRRIILCAKIRTKDDQYIRPDRQMTASEISNLYKGRRYDGWHVKK